MSHRPLAPQNPDHQAQSMPVPTTRRARKASSACLACKHRKSKVPLPPYENMTWFLISVHKHQCCQGMPCKVCQMHQSPCVYDEAADQRRKIAKERMFEEYQRQRLFLMGILAIVRAEDSNQTDCLLRLIRGQLPLQQVSNYVEGMINASPRLKELCQQMILGPNDFPPQPSSLNSSPRQAEARPRLRGPLNANVTLMDQS